MALSTEANPCVFASDEIVQLFKVCYPLPGVPLGFHHGVGIWSPVRKVWLREIYWGGNGYSKIPAGTWEGCTPVVVEGTKVVMSYGQAMAAIHQAIKWMAGEYRLFSKNCNGFVQKVLEFAGGKEDGPANTFAEMAQQVSFIPTLAGYTDSPFKANVTALAPRSPYAVLPSEMPKPPWAVLAPMRTTNTTLPPAQHLLRINSRLLRPQQFLQVLLPVLLPVLRQVKCFTHLRRLVALRKVHLFKE